MSQVFVIIRKRQDQGVFVPTFEVVPSVPADKKSRVITLEIGECVDLYDCNLSKDGTSVIVDQYIVSNVDGEADQISTESYLIKRIK